MHPTYSITLEHSQMVSTNTRHLRFRTQAPFAYRPGEFISLILHDEQGEFRRSYSIASVHEDPTQATDIELVASFVESGRATRWLWQAQPGCEIQFAGPHGQLTLPAPLPKRLFLLATGTGVAPYRAMLKQMHNALAQGEHDIYVLFGARTRDEAIFVDDFRAFAAHHPQFHFHFCLSRESASATDEFQGRVTQCLEQFNPALETDLVYLCGNPAMVDEIYESLKARGFGPKAVRREKYIFSRG
jgi:ferredoxin-NADP reductase